MTLEEVRNDIDATLEDIAGIDPGVAVYVQQHLSYDYQLGNISYTGDDPVMLTRYFKATQRLAQEGSLCRCSECKQSQHFPPFHQEGLHQ